MKDVLIIGLGLAGISLCERLEAKGKTFDVYTDTSQKSSLVAGGLYNPVILKRFTMAWRADAQMDVAIPFYQQLQTKLGAQLDYKVKVLRRFTSIEEQNTWFEAADKPRLARFLNTYLHKNTNDGIDAPFGYGEVLETGRVATEKLVQLYAKYLEGISALHKTTFLYQDLQMLKDGVAYQGKKYEKVVFAEGFGLKSNPYFNYLPLNGTKGELLTVKIPGLRETSVIKSSVFIIPLEEDVYRIGATYKWKDKTNTPTDAAKEELLEKLEKFLKLPYTVEKHVAGIRPTVTDRRPLVGRHPIYEQLYVLNGFGSRGVLIAPEASNQLVDAMYGTAQLHPEIDIQRFQNKYVAST
ncbi:FAD-binding oxidoreductase [Flavobacterium sp. ASW18X]|uniref:NAD(P)/FAD-dependent oxidoreductase n=1 Tax=Flavobacterium sp. ASW18X TaxID=2572595 RepID=UPI0010ADBC7B|nr:FAD-binding oxidoreductase [Flavobacterium sp. ASW18X]TKD60937.1 FAD-binding oxidoreductase [Flavobacterium sp. ASW18X]